MIDLTCTPIRTFIAIDLPACLHAALHKTMRLIDQQNIPRLRPIKRGSAHITIKFLGEFESNHIPSLVEAIQDNVLGMQAFTISINNLRLHPNSSDPRFAFFEIAHSKELGELKLVVDEACRKFGVKNDSLSWFPHITIARIPRSKTRSERRYIGERLKTIPAFCKTMTVSQFSIMSSDLGRSGPTYNTLERIQLSPKTIK